MHAQNVHALKIFLELGSSVELSTDISTNSHRREEISELCVNAEKEKSRLQLDKENCFSRPIADLNPALKSFDIPTKSSGRVPTINTSKLGFLVNNGGLDACAPIYTSSKLDEAERVGGLPEVGRKSIEMVDVGTQADPVKKRIDMDSGNSEVFLSNEEEASTSVPRTLKKCCSSIVPKKRKRHMETKHMTAGSAKRRLSSSEPTNIFIDLEPHEDYMVADCSQQYDDAYGDSQEDFKVKTEDSINRPSHSKGMKKSRSVIIQPGTTFSIPVSYALGMTPTFEISSFNSSRWMSPTTSSLLQPQKVMQELPTTKSSSFVIFKDDRSNVSVSSSYPTPAASSEQLFESLPGEKYDYYQASDQLASVSFERDERGEDGQYQKKRRYPTSRPFKCDQCTDSFNQRIHLKKHQSKHTGNKNSIFMPLYLDVIFLHCSLLVALFPLVFHNLCSMLAWVLTFSHKLCFFTYQDPVHQKRKIFLDNFTMIIYIVFQRDLGYINVYCC